MPYETIQGPITLTGGFNLFWETMSITGFIGPGYHFPQVFGSEGAAIIVEHQGAQSIGDIINNYIYQCNFINTSQSSCQFNVLLGTF
jgi:hypothetical protein